MSQTEDGGGHTPRQAQQGADPRHDAHYQHVQVVAAPLLQLVLLPVDDDGGDLLVHEEQDGEEDGGEGGQEVDVPLRLGVKQGDQPASDIVSGGLNMGVVLSVEQSTINVIVMS